MSNKRDNIYVYVWEEFNTIYIGRTINPKSRHYQHKHIPTERTYQFSSEHGVEHPKMIIIENDLTIEEGAEREKYWINEYRENSYYNVLNKTPGGEIGNAESKILTEEERLQNNREYARRYYHNNREKELAKNKKYCELHHQERCLYFKEYNEVHKEERKAYQESIKERRKEYMREYRKLHNEKINRRKRELYRNKKDLTT
jgi:hypothetical protein